jgi:hypothetical protein
MTARDLVMVAAGLIAGGTFGIVAVAVLTAARLRDDHARRWGERG